MTRIVLNNSILKKTLILIFLLVCHCFVNAACLPYRFTNQDQITPLSKEELISFEEKAKQGDAEALYQLALRMPTYDTTLTGYSGGCGSNKKLFDTLTKAANKGHVLAQYELGKYSGDISWYKKAAEKQYEPAYLTLGVYYMTIDPKESLFWLKKAATSNSKARELLTKIKYGLVEIYFSNETSSSSDGYRKYISHQKDKEATFNWLVEQVNLDSKADVIDTVAIAQLLKDCNDTVKKECTYWKYQLRVRRIKRSEVKSITNPNYLSRDDLIACADVNFYLKENKINCIQLLSIPYSPQVLTIQQEQEVRKLDKSKTFNADTMYRIGLFYENGSHITVKRDIDINVAVLWYRKAALKGHLEATWRLANLLAWDEREGEKQESVQLYLKLLSQGYLDVTYRLGIAYDLGNGIERDLSKAIYWYKISIYWYQALEIINGNVYDYSRRVDGLFAINRLNELIVNSFIDSSYTVDAIEWLEFMSNKQPIYDEIKTVCHKKSISCEVAIVPDDINLVLAYFMLGKLYLEGDGKLISKDEEKAIYWLLKAQAFTYSRELLLKLYNENRVKNTVAKEIIKQFNK